MSSDYHFQIHPQIHWRGQDIHEIPSQHLSLIISSHVCTSPVKSQEWRYII